MAKRSAVPLPNTKHALNSLNSSGIASEA